MGGFVSKVCSVVAKAAKDAAEALWAFVTRAARKVASFFSALFRAAPSAMKRAAAAAAHFEVPKGAKIAAGVVVAAVLMGLAFGCFMPAGAMMVAPGVGGGLMILRSAFVANPALYFNVLRAAGPAAAVAAATLAFFVPLCAFVI